MKKTFILILILSLLLAFDILNIRNNFNIDHLKANLDWIKSLESNHRYSFIFIFFITYISVTYLSIPGAALIMTIAAGSIFGFITGTIIVSFASSVSATFAFITARYLFRDLVNKKLTKTINKINLGVKREGALYLFTLRLIPIMPFFVINLVMGLTTISIKTFYLISQIGMLAGTMAYVNAGSQLTKINSFKEIISADMLVSFVIIGFLPLISKKIIDIIHYQKKIISKK